MNRIVESSFMWRQHVERMIVKCLIKGVINYKPKEEETEVGPAENIVSRPDTLNI